MYIACDFVYLVIIEFCVNSKGYVYCNWEWLSDRVWPLKVNIDQYACFRCLLFNIGVIPVAKERNLGLVYQLRV